MDAFPAFIPLAGRRIVVAGTGEAADAKARLFDGSPAELVRIEAAEAALRPETWAGAALGFVAGDAAWAAQAAACARKAGVLVNVVDRPALSDFHTPAIVDRGAVVGAIGTGGAAPVLATRLRTEWEARWPEGLGRLAELLRAVQAEARDRWPDQRARRTVLRTLLDGPAAAAALADEPEAEAMARVEIAGAAPTHGAVLRVRAPPSADDLTLRDLRALSRADRLVAGPEVPPALLAYARRDATRHAAASPAESEAWLAAGETVVLVSAAGTDPPG